MVEKGICINCGGNMSRVRMVQNDQASTELNEIYNNLTRNGARIINLYRVIAHNPRALLNFMRLGNSLLVETELQPKLRELAILRIAKLAGSDYEWSQHYPLALELGINQKQIQEISSWVNSTNFNEIERAVLQYTDEVTRNVEVKDETFKELQRHLNEKAIVELTLSIGYWGMVAHVLVPLKIDIDTKTISSTHELTGR
jgi:4-carboxymuconolactone decarboxylase